MYLNLICHPDTPATAIESVDVEVDRSEDRLSLIYTVFGDDQRLVIPPEIPRRRRDELWQTTCFEAFLRRPGENGYREYNFSPSSEWAAYALDSYREGRRDAEVVHAPTIAVTGYEKVLEVHVTAPLDPSEGALLAGLSVILEEIDGTKSYWALAHPPGKPDFHHADCFALELPAA